MFVFQAKSVAIDMDFSNGQDEKMNANNNLLNQAERLVQDGDYRSAISLLEQDGHFDDSALAQRLVELRIQAYGNLNWPQPHPDWPPAHDNRYADVQGFPEVDFKDLDAGALKAGILGKGGLIVRGLMNSEETRQRMRDNIDRTLRARMTYYDEKRGHKKDPWYQRSSVISGGPTQFRGGERFTTIGSVWSADSPPLAFQLVDFYRQIGLPQLLHDYFDEDPVLSVRKWVVRCAAPNNGAAAGWHQDGQFLGDATKIRTANLWIALTDCGGDADAPGMEIVAGNERKIYETGTHGAPFNWTVGQGLVDEITKSCSVECPRFKPGDAIFFDHFNLHRTGFGLNHSKNRYAIESWFFAGSTAPLKQQPVVF